MTPPELRGDGGGSPGLLETPRAVIEYLPWAPALEAYAPREAEVIEDSIDARDVAVWRRWGWLSFFVLDLRGRVPSGWGA